MVNIYHSEQNLVTTKNLFEVPKILDSDSTSCGIGAIPNGLRCLSQMNLSGWSFRLELWFEGLAPVGRKGLAPGGRKLTQLTKLM